MIGAMPSGLTQGQPGHRPRHLWCHMLDLNILSLRRRAERLLAPWRATNGPGATIGIVLGNDLAIHESAGLASIEHTVPIGPTTTFRIASVSKQFTCTAILLLAAEGKLSPDDDIRDHLPGLPDLGHRITLDHLMHNTSGIRDMLEIMRLGGIDLGHPIEPQDLLDGVYRQRGLNFAPGSRYLYSNSNFMLLGRIVEHVSGEPFRDFLDRRIFSPLGMNATRHVERTTEVCQPRHRLFPRARRWLDAGAARFSAARRRRPGFICYRSRPLARQHFASPRVGGTAAGKRADRDDAVQQRPAQHLRARPAHQAHRGVRTIGHDGLWPGYKTSFVRIPDHDAAVICISNDGALRSA